MGAVKTTLTGVLCAAALAMPATAARVTEDAKLTASDGAADNLFGWSVSVSGDTAVVGALDGDGSAIDSGSAYVYVRSGSSWSEQDKLTASDGVGWDNFGISVSVSGDMAVVGAEYDDDNGSNSGSAYVYVRSGSTWSEQAKLMASDGAMLDEFGLSVSVSGETAVVGAIWDNDNEFDSGSAYVFDLPSLTGLAWGEGCTPGAGSPIVLLLAAAAITFALRRRRQSARDGSTPSASFPGLRESAPQEPLLSPQPPRYPNSECRRLVRAITT